VAQVNARVRGWLNGDDIPTPFMPGQRALLRAPVIVDEQILLDTNEEAIVVSIEESQKNIRVMDGDDLAWRVDLPTWHLDLLSDSAAEVEVHMVRDDRACKAVISATRPTRRRAWMRRKAYPRQCRGYRGHGPARSVAHSHQRVRSLLADPEKPEDESEAVPEMDDGGSAALDPQCRRDPPDPCADACGDLMTAITPNLNGQPHG
jgi:hypothetical protein